MDSSKFFTENNNLHRPNVKFYKYLNPKATRAVLENKTLKWSNPKLFNDPFDFPRGINFHFDGEELAKILIDEMVKLTYGENSPSGDIRHPLFAISKMARENANKPNEENFRREMMPVIKKTARNFHVAQDGLRKFYQDSRDKFTVLCVSKKKDNLLMWAHYAKDHSGCVLKFRCLPELDRPLCMAQEVVYQSKYPSIANLQDYVKHLTGQKELNYDNLFREFAFTKSKHWKYEEEWRCISLLMDKELGFDYYPIIPEELESIYIGCRATEYFKDEVKDLIASHFPKTKIHQASVSAKNYSLEFEQIH